DAVTSEAPRDLFAQRLETERGSVLPETRLAAPRVGQRRDELFQREGALIGSETREISQNRGGDRPCLLTADLLSAIGEKQIDRKWVRRPPGAGARANDRSASDPCLDDSALGQSAVRRLHRAPVDP